MQKYSAGNIRQEQGVSNNVPSVRSSITTFNRPQTPVQVKPLVPHVAPAAGKSLNVPVTREEIADFNLGFTTKPKIARTPLTQSLSAAPGEFKEIRRQASNVRTSLNQSGVDQIRNSRRNEV